MERDSGSTGLIWLALRLRPPWQPGRGSLWLSIPVSGRVGVEGEPFNDGRNGRSGDRAPLTDGDTGHYRPAERLPGSGNEDWGAPVSTTQSVRETRVPGGCPDQV